MKFVIIDPWKRSVTQVDVSDLDKAKQIAGLDKVDFGTIVFPKEDHDKLGVGVIVYEFGLFVPPEEQRYFEIGKHLVAGVAVLFGFNERGESVDLTRWPPPCFFGSIETIEKAIADGQIIRPQITVNGVSQWQWPQPN